MKKPFTAPELSLALKQMKTCKSSGPNGLPTQYNKSFSSILTPHYLHTFNSLSQHSSQPSQLLKAHITVIHKKGKDETLVQNYGSVSLLNVDMKNFKIGKVIPALSGMTITKMGKAACTESGTHLTLEVDKYR